ncbi:MAG: zinc ribbon domain-containing protein [Anaerolineales bacterium]
MKRLRVAALLLAFTLLLAGTVHAQSDLLVNTAQVQLWPEYDQPAMLVIYTLELADAQLLPADVTVRIPASVGDPMAVAVLEESGLVTRQYTRTVDGEWAEITLETDFPVVQIEYYDSALSQEDPQRSYDFTWNSEFAVDSFVFSVKQPVNAVDFSTVPSLGIGQTDSDGLMTYTASFGSLAANQSFQLSLSYTKNDTTLATESFVPNSGTTASEPATVGALPVWGWVLIGVGVVVIAGGAVFYIRSNRKATPSKYKARKQRSAASKPAVKPAAQGAVFCHQCGTRAETGDKFCRECGTRLRG